MRRAIEEVTIDRELKYWDRAALGTQTEILTETEILIYDTLNKLVPDAARSYKQAIIDLYDSDRLSYRGVANELRETLRETLDYLAPDQDVTAHPGFQYEKDEYGKDRKAPTFKQKVRYLLRAREIPDNAVKVPEEAVAVVEDRVASFARAIYDRSSISAHVASERHEVVQIKNYVNVVLSEILALQT